MSTSRASIEFECPWCNSYQTRQVYQNAETDVTCTSCKQLIGIVTDANAKPTRISSKVHVVKPVEMSESTAKSESKLSKTEADIEKARKEAERRGLVVESKVYGAAIEIIDRLRDQVKQQDEMAKEITKLQEHAKQQQESGAKEIAELKQHLDFLQKKVELYKSIK